MRKALLVALVLLIAVGTVMADPSGSRDPLCPSGRDYEVWNTFAASWCIDEDWKFDDISEWPFCDLRDNEPQGRHGNGQVWDAEDGFLASRNLVTTNPVAETWSPDWRGVNPFHGDWKLLEVVSFRAELLVHEKYPLLPARPVSLILINDSGTPDDEADDCHVFFASGMVPAEPKNNIKSNWKWYEMLVPSGSEQLPQPNAGLVCPSGFDCTTCPSIYEPCWGVYQFNACPTKTDYDLTWSTVIQDVDGIRIMWGHPEFPTLEQAWKVGADNISLYSCQPLY